MHRQLPETVENPEEAWLVAVDAELTELAAEAEKTERMPESLLLRPPPPGGVDLITPDPRRVPHLLELYAAYYVLLDVSSSGVRCHVFRLF